MDNIEKIFTEDGLWMQIEDDFAFIGITEEMCESLGSLEKIESVTDGDELVKGEVFCTISGNGDEIDLRIPFDCLILDVNYDLIDDPDSLKGFCMDNWIISAKIFDCAELGIFSSLLEDNCEEDDLILDEIESAEEEEMF